MVHPRIRKSLPFVLGRRFAYRSVLCPILLIIIMFMFLPTLSGAQQACQPDGDVDRNGSVTAADALQVFQQALGLAQLDTCQQTIADVFPRPASPDGAITASDALCIFQKALSLPSCLDTLTADIERFVAVSSGGSHSCGIQDSGVLECWGDDDDGQSTPPTGTFASVSAGGSYTCGVRDTGVVTCWGYDYSGQATPPTGTFASVNAGGSYTCGVRDTGVVTCWGYDYSGQATPPTGTFASVSAGDSHTCGVRDTGVVECWGNDAYGQSTPPTGMFASVSAGDFHTCGVRDTGVVECWGNDVDGQSTPPTGTFASVGAGTFHTCGVRDTGVVECWGNDAWGQSTPPTGTFVSVSAGDFHTCGVRDTGVVECWGDDSSGQSTPPAELARPTVALSDLTPDPAQGRVLTMDYSGPDFDAEDLQIYMGDTQVEAVVIGDQIHVLLPVTEQGETVLELYIASYVLELAIDIEPAPTIAEPDTYVAGLADGLIAELGVLEGDWGSEIDILIGTKQALMDLEEDELYETAILLKQNVEPALTLLTSPVVTAYNEGACDDAVTIFLKKMNSALASWVFSNLAKAIKKIKIFQILSNVATVAEISLIISSIPDLLDMSDVCTFTQVLSITSIDDPLTSQTTIMFTEFEKRDFSVTLSERFTHPRMETVLRKAQDVIESLYDLKFKLNVGALVTVFRVPQHTQLIIAVTKAFNEKIDNVLLPLEDFANNPDREEPANHRNFRLTAISNLDIGGFITAETTEDRLVMQFFLDGSGSIPQGGLDFTFTLSLGPTNEEIEFSARLLAPESPEPPDDFNAVPLDDFNVTIPSSCAQQVQICVHDWACEDGDEITVSVNGAEVLRTELFHEPKCIDMPVREGENTINLFAINDSGYKCGGGCGFGCTPGDPASFSKVNSGEIAITGDQQTQRWEHRGGTGSTANLNVTVGPPGSCPSTSGVDPAPPGSRCLEHPNRPLVIARKPCDPSEGPTGTSIYLGACCTDVCDEIDMGYPTCPLFARRSSTPELQECRYWAHEQFGYIPLPACP